MTTRTLLGVRLHAITHQEVQRWCDVVLANGGFHHIVTPNPEFLLEAAQNVRFRSILNGADLRLPDGAGLRLLSLLTPGPIIPERITGIDTIEIIAKICQIQHKRIVLFGGRNQVAEQAADSLARRYPGLKAMGLPDVGSLRQPNEREEEIIPMVIGARPDVLLVALGSPLQDLWIDAHRSILKNVTLAMGVGGSFDFLSGRIARAPRWMQKAGVEWFFRLCREPRRWRRILRATIVFPWKVLTHRKLQEKAS